MIDEPISPAVNPKIIYLEIQQRLRCAVISEEALLQCIFDQKIPIQEKIVMNAYRKGLIVLKFEWEAEEEPTGGQVLFATLAKFPVI